MKPAEAPGGDVRIDLMPRREARVRWRRRRIIAELAVAVMVTASGSLSFHRFESQHERMRAARDEREAQSVAARLESIDEEIAELDARIAQDALRHAQAVAFANRQRRIAALLALIAQTISHQPGIAMRSVVINGSRTELQGMARQTRDITKWLAALRATDGVDTASVGTIERSGGLMRFVIHAEFDAGEVDVGEAGAAGGLAGGSA